MLPILLVFLLAAESVFGASVAVTQQLIGETPRPNSLYEGVFETIDGGDTNIYTLTIQNIVNDLGNQPDANSQAIALGTTLGVLGELAYGSTGDACAYANAVNEFVSYLGSGNSAGLRYALQGVIGRLNSAIDSIASVAVDSGALKNSRGPSGGCAGGGRSYQFQTAWDFVRASANINNESLLNELYCASRRLYNANNDRSNYVSAAVSATVTGPVVNVVSGASPQILNFFRAVTSGNANAIASAAAGAKGALARSAANARF